LDLQNPGGLEDPQRRVQGKGHLKKGPKARYEKIMVRWKKEIPQEEDRRLFINSNL